MRLTFRGEKLQIIKRQYAAGGTRLDIVDEGGCPYAVLTKHDAAGICAEDEFLVKAYAENVEIAAAVKPFFEDTGRRIPTGYVELEVWRLRVRMIKPRTIGTSECPNLPRIMSLDTETSGTPPEGLKGVAITDDSRFDTQDKGTMPEHMAAWGVTPDTYENWQAMWSTAFRREHPIVGCPLGTGRSERAAKKDLIARTNAESKTSFKLGE